MKNISFDGTQYMYVPVTDPAGGAMDSNGEDITMRFRTAMSSGEFKLATFLKIFIYVSP